ncbi:DUF86 domain-containing protein [Bacillus massiliglaciei]|uniref:DUF86 domain-containing protein n=1 Tax=Bacillus massiliglaciei TaxID=1816693 RepID=UPI000A5642AC|nr:DUF86 domain-containing protein [Bacillus massiliglaciei]
MYFVDRQKIEQILCFLEKQLDFLEKREMKDDYSKLAMERAVQTSIDAVLDVGNALIDGFIMRDPGSYEDIIDILLDEKVIAADAANQFKSILPLRKMLVQDYMEVSHERLEEGFNKSLPAFRTFPEVVRNYLTTELGPVSAFKN